MVTSRTASPALVPTRLAGFLFAVVLAVLAPAAPASAQAGPDGRTAPGLQAAADAHASGSGADHDAPSLRGTRTPPPLLAGHPAAPVLPPAERGDPCRPAALLPAPPAISAAHLAHRSPLHGRAPPPGTRI